MGVNANIGYGKFPKQGSWLNKRVEVCYNYDTSQTEFGTIIRDDEDAPGILLIKLDSGNVLLATECQYSLV